MTTNEIIRLENIRRNFIVGSETVHALRGVNFTINSGEFVTIMGTSGSGKSTLLNILGCLDTPTSGEYYLDGISVRSMGKKRTVGFAKSENRVRISILQLVTQNDRTRKRGITPHVQLLHLGQRKTRTGIESS